ncbi:TetR/AcrR family transcriptional regulator [Liquorilactobacillus vini]|uniref:Transcriptional regulator n=1 Tax=Liquorilactobacillus vini DSM 20605 TaxID=1133569 RepID=A0A0R2CCR4_9LACO|nr:TetR/AcrR family transcriptional regulator [Liquorilactobacillus vini]KRM89582.1 transcriptional regulator [Liquorilactobacillus vini DSM 20605]
MPTTTFYHLDPQKKQRLFEAALAEFSQKSFADSAISEIIRRAKIPRGSFYQYFEDKLDCYLYFVSQIQTERNQTFLKALNESDGNLLLATRKFYQISINEIINGPYATYFQIMIQAHDFRLHRRLPHGGQQQLINQLYENTNLQLLKVNGIDQFRCLIEMILNIFFRSVGRYFYCQQAGNFQPVETIKKQCLTMLSWLENGVVK